MTGGVRPPAVAGRFYPAAARDLADLVDAMLAAATPPAAQPPARAYVVPHAGYRFSGPTAAAAYARLRRDAAGVRRVVLIGPAHSPLIGCRAPHASAWATPLGRMPVDDAAVSALAAATGLVSRDDRPHAAEHSLEVQVPFLQRVLPAGVPLLPVVVGRAPTEQVAALLAAATGVPGTVVLCSTDLSHYLDESTAQARDGRTARAMLDLADDRIGDRDACGAYPLRGLLAWARGAGLRAELLHRCTSADATGDTTRVVGYAAVMLTAG